jgi:hypothetical protein
MTVQHKNLAAGRWAQMSLCEQMVNVGSEVSRALNWRKKGNDKLSKRAVVRRLNCCTLQLRKPMKCRA